MTAPTLLHPNHEIVTVAWLRTVPGVNPGNVATTLPQDTAAWAADGFVQPWNSGGGSDMYVPLRRPVMTVSCWAINPNSGKPPWGKANHLAESIAAHTYADNHAPIELRAAYAPALLHSVYVVGEPQRINDDDTAYARYDITVALSWTTP